MRGDTPLVCHRPDGLEVSMKLNLASGSEGLPSPRWFRSSTYALGILMCGLVCHRPDGLEESALEKAAEAPVSLP